MALQSHFPLLTGDNAGRKTATAGTAIALAIPGKEGAYTRLMRLVYTTTGTAHTLGVMRALGETTIAAAAAADQAVITITANPGPAGNSLATNDYVVYKTDAGLYVVDTVTVSSLTLTLGSNLAAAISAGNKLWMFGLVTDSDPKTGAVHPLFSNAATATDRDHYDDTIGIVCGHETGEPLVVYSSNGTNAGVIERAVYAHSRNGRK